MHTDPINYLPCTMSGPGSLKDQMLMSISHFLNHGVGICSDAPPPSQAAKGIKDHKPHFSINKLEEAH